MRFIVVFLVVALIALQYKLWLGDGGFSELNRTKHKIKAQQTRNQALEARNSRIRANIHELKSGEQALEEQARFELGMIKEGETFYQLID